MQVDLPTVAGACAGAGLPSNLALTLTTLRRRNEAEYRLDNIGPSQLNP
jgi:hypothetical protein